MQGHDIIQMLHKPWTSKMPLKGTGSAVAAYCMLLGRQHMVA